ncbi:MAG: PaaI family thioesterase [Acidimicrobiales bacterium]
MAEERVRLPPEAMSTWILSGGEITEARAAKHRLVAEVRRLIEAVARVDIAGGVALPVDETAALADRVERLPHFAGGAAEAGLDDSRLLERSGMSGASNPLASPMQIWRADDCIRGSAVYGYAYEGPPGCVHGGFVAAAFDDLLGSAQTLSGSAGFTGTLHVRMLRPTPLHQRIDYEGRVKSFVGRKIVATATASCADEVVAEAEGLFIIPRDGDQDERMTRAAAPLRAGANDRVGEHPAD